MNRKLGASAYAKVGIQGTVLSASPHKLISLLFDALDVDIGKARNYIQAGDGQRKREAISHALDVVNGGLLAALDMEVGGELAERLKALYEYVARMLVTANAHDDIKSLDVAGNILRDIGSAWRQIEPEPRRVEHA